MLNKHYASSVSMNYYIDPECSLILNRSVNHISTGNSRIKIITCPSKNVIPFRKTLHHDNHDRFTSHMNIVSNSLVENYLLDPLTSKYTKQLCKYLVSVHSNFGSFCAGTRVTYHLVRNGVHKNNVSKV